MGNFGNNHKFTGWIGTNPAFGPAPSPTGAGDYWWSVVRKAGYLGPAADIRRSSDNTILTVNYVNNGSGLYVIDTATALAFVGSGNGFIARLYDNGSQANHLVSAGIGYEPFIIQAGVVRTVNGLPSIFFNQAPAKAFFFLTYRLTVSTPVSCFSVVQPYDLGGFPDQGLALTPINTQGDPSFGCTPILYYDQGVWMNMGINGNVFLSDPVSYTTPTIVSGIYPAVPTPANVKLYANADLLITNDGGFYPAFTTLVKFADYGNDTYGRGDIQHLELYNGTDKTAQAAAIISGLNSIFNCY